METSKSMSYPLVWDLCETVTGSDNRFVDWHSYTLMDALHGSEIQDAICKNATTNGSKTDHITGILKYQIKYGKELEGKL